MTGIENAFPAISFDSEGQINIERDGLTIRQYFAAMFMQSILTYSKNPIINTAKDAVDAADILIEALNKTEK